MSEFRAPGVRPIRPPRAITPEEQRRLNTEPLFPSNLLLPQRPESSILENENNG